MFRSLRVVARMDVALLPLVAALPATSQGVWQERATFLPGSGPEPLLRLGESVALSGDTAVVGGPGELALGVDHGKALVFVRSGTDWTEQAVLTAGNGGQGWFSDQFGASVDVDDDRIVVGAPDQDLSLTLVETGQAHVYVWTGTTWFEEKQLISSDADPNEFFAASVALSGDLILCGTPKEDATFVDEGAVYVFFRTFSDWVEEAVLFGSGASDDAYFGRSVALDGHTAVVGAPGDASTTGKAYVFVRGGTGWVEEAVLSVAGGTPGNLFGASVALDGERVVVGAPGQGNGTAYVYGRSGTTWTERAQLTASDPDPTDEFGGSVALDGDRALVGAALDDVGGLIDAGSVYAFQRSGTVWSEDVKIVAGSPGPATFGTAVALTHSTAWIGAPLHDEGLVLAGVKGLAPVPGGAAGQVLDHTTGVLAELDATTADATVVASFGPNDVKSLAYDSVSATLYGVDVVTDDLVALDPAGGVLNVVGPVGFDRVHGLAYDPNAGVLYGVDRATAQLITIDTATGAGTAVGPLEMSGARGLAFDPNTNTLWAAGGSQGQALYKVDQITGEATFERTLNGQIEGLSFDPVANLLYVAEVQNGWLVAYDAQGRNGNIIGIMGSQPDAGRAHVFERTLPTPETYCTAGTSSSACNALLSATGTPSASAPSGFDLTAVSVEGTVDGLFFYGTNGRQANSWGNGTSYQCVVPPVKRGGLLNGSGTSGLCDGSFSQDLNALWSSNPTKNPGAGALVGAQLWYRDPFNTSNQTTSLSNALEFSVAP